MLNTGRARTDLPTIAVRSGLGSLGGLAVGSFLGCAALTAMVISHVATDGVTLAAAASLLFTGGAGVRCVMVVRKIGRAGLRRRLAVSADVLERPGRAAWGRVVAVEYAKEDARGIVYTHIWTIRFDDRPPVTVRYPAGAPVRPRYYRHLVRRLAPHVQVSGGWW